MSDSLEPAAGTAPGGHGDRPPGTSRLGLAVAAFILLVALGSAAFVLYSRDHAPAPGPTPARPRLRVLAAASLTEPLRKIAAMADAVDVELSFAASSAQERQIAAGAECDVFVSAAAGPVERLIAQNLLEPESRRTIAENDLVAVVPAGTQAPSGLAALESYDRIAVGAKGVPVGDYAREALERAGLWPRLEAKLASYPDEPSVLTAVVHGGAPVGFVYASSVKPGPQRPVAAFTVDPSLHSRIVYVAAVARATKDPIVARQFVIGFGSESWRQKLLEAGFRLPRAP